jgi:hypothetical protein
MIPLYCSRVGIDYTPIAETFEATDPLQRIYREHSSEITMFGMNSGVRERKKTKFRVRGQSKTGVDDEQSFVWSSSDADWRRIESSS